MLFVAAVGEVVTYLMEVRSGDTGTFLRLHVALSETEPRPACLGM
jgi:hypothetical protein